jgi:hypothetical protein
MEMVDVYESTPLFKKLWPKLLKGYALDAIAVTGDEDAASVFDVADAKRKPTRRAASLSRPDRRPT